MITVALFILAALQNPEAQRPKAEKPLYDTYITQPTGNNAFEDYLRCADALNTPEYLDISRAINVVQGFYAGESPEDNKLPDWAKNKSALDLERMRVAKFEPALKWITEGNKKPFSISAQFLTPDAPMKWLTRWKAISKFAASAARVHFADDDPAGATDILIENLKFGQNIRSTNMISDLVGIACQSIVLAVIEVNLTNLGENDWNQLNETTDDFLRQPPPLANALPAEKANYPEGIHETMQTAMTYDPTASTDDDYSDPDLASIAASVKKMTAAERDQLEKQTTDFISSLVDSSVATLSGPEGKWPLPGQPDPTPPSPIVGQLAGLTTPVFPQMFFAEARNRVQLRLLLVHGLIQNFRWRNNRLPKDLDELGEPNAIMDQLVGGKFSYEIDGPSYKLYSRNINGEPKIELRWRRPPSTGNVAASDQPDVP